MAAKRGRRPVKYYSEYFIINVFVFIGIWLLSFMVLNISIFNNFTHAFKDFTLTDIYYTSIINKNTVYDKTPLILVNIEDKDRGEIAFLLQRLEEGNPKVIGADIIFHDKKDPAQDSLLKNTLARYNNIILPYIASFDTTTEEVKTDPYFRRDQGYFVNLIGEQREFSTIRYYYPVYNNQVAFTSAIVNLYDSVKAEKLLKRGQQKTEIHYAGNVQNFNYYSFDNVMQPSFDPSILKGKIILIGYMGVSGKVNALDGDRFFTPMNQQLSGRSYPDMYGVVINANILRMVLDNDYIYVFPSWLNWLLAFMLSLFLLPLFVRWYVEKAVWFHLFTIFIQLLFSIFFVFFTIWLYAKANIKIESSAVLVSILLIGDFLLFYDHLVKFLKYKLKWNFHSKFLRSGH